MKRFLKNPLKTSVTLIILSAILAFIVYILPGNEKKTPAEQITGAEKKLVDMRVQMLSSLDNISHLNEKELQHFFITCPENNGFSFYVLKKNIPQYWSDNEPAISDSLLSAVNNDDFLHLDNGDFIACVLKNGDRKIAGLILVKHAYEYENKYLVNDFNPLLKLGAGFSVSNSAGDTLHLPDNKAAYVLKFDPSASTSAPLLVTWLYLIISFFIYVASYLLINILSKRSFLHTALFILFIVGVRTLMIYFKIPSGLYDHSIFSPEYYASSFYFNSLGDMLFNAALLLVLCVSLYENIQPCKKYKFVLILSWLLSAFGVHFLISGLVINSRISFELSSPADINLYSILAFTSISILLLCFLFVTAAILKSIYGYVVKGSHAWTGISVCAIYCVIVLSTMNSEKEYETRKLIAQRAEMREDRIAEYLFREQEDKIIYDPYIMQAIHSGINVNEKLNTFINQKYFNGYLSKFELNVQAFDEKTDSGSAGFEYYRQKVKQGKSTFSNHLTFLSNENGRSSYIAILPLIEDDKSHRHILVMEMAIRFLNPATGFPELFISGRYQDNFASDKYSLARYSGQSLIYEYGDYVYPLKGNDFSSSRSEFDFVKINNYDHLVYHLNANSFIIVSKKSGTTIGELTLFSWMFTLISILAFIVLVLSGIFGQKEWKWTLTRRVQVSVLFLVVLTFVFVGYGTIYYINRKYNTDQKKSISDQINALWFMISGNLSSSPGNENAEQRQQLDRLVNNTNIDFNIYDANGGIFYSSQPKIFDKGIISGRMNPAAYLKIKETGATQFIHPENAGRLKYIAGYAPFTDRSGNINAFLNLPYFEKQNELNKEVSVFLSSLVNIYVLLFALAVLVTIFISSRITKSLLLIQEKMSGIRLGATNEKIAYSENDEIGQLVHEYNRMIDELSVSAGKLARSERESAWREMARQIAHEIKNPLTPMKLSVQHLQRTVKENGNGDTESVDRIAKTLIQQIDTLSNIATAFSNFAQMPQPTPVRINLNELLQQVAELYNHETTIELVSDDDNYFVTADRDQAIGIFSNLLKNAVQSIPDERPGKITISLRREVGCIVTEIADNGIGIPEDQRDKIFIPNFTTKSSGMGLGLAIVRNIVEEASGKIWFTSIYGTGSTFFVSLPESI